MSMLHQSANLLQLRKSALALHGMTAPDRSWVMEQLLPDQRTQLEPLLAELESIDFPIPNNMLPEILKINDNVMRSKQATSATWSDLTQFSPEAWHTVLAKEPHELVAQVARHLPSPLRLAISKLDKHGRLHRLLNKQIDFVPAQQASTVRRDQHLREALHAELTKHSPLANDGDKISQAVERQSSIKGHLRALPLRFGRVLKR